MNSKQVVQILKQVKILQDLEEGAFEILANKGIIINLKEAEVLLTEGKIGQTMFFVLDGELEIYREKVSVAFKRKYDFFGEMALIESQTRSASAKANKPTILLEIDKNTFDKYLKNNSSVVIQILKVFSQRTRTDLSKMEIGYSKLEEKERQYCNIVESVSDIIIQIGPDEKICFANSAVKYLGFSPEEMIGQPLDKFIDPERKDTVLPRLLTKRVGDRSTSNLEVSMKVNENSEFSEKASNIMLLADAAGLWDVPNEIVSQRGSEKNFLGFQFVARDITSIKKAQERINHRLRFEKGLADAAHKLMVVKTEDADHTVKEALTFLLNAANASRISIFQNNLDNDSRLSANQNFIVYSSDEWKVEEESFVYDKMGFGRWRDELSLGNPITGPVAIFPEYERRYLSEEDILAVLVLPMFIKGEWFGFIRIDDCLRDAEWSQEDIGLLHAGAGIIAGFLERKLFQEELEWHRDSLQLLIDDQTSDLKDAKEKAEKANYAKSEFLSKMSHELRTPLNAILGFAQLFNISKKDPLTKWQKQNIQHILKAGGHLLDLINEVLDLSKIESGNLEVLNDDVLLNSLIEEVVYLVRPIGEQKQISVINEVPEDRKVWVKGDLIRLKQALLNLASNGIKYNNPEGVVKIDAITQNGQVIVKVQDSGIGIPEDKLKEVFEPFSRLEIETSPVEGTGIGLSITKKLIELMNGSLKVSSRLGEGSLFEIELIAGMAGKEEVPIKVEETETAEHVPGAEFFKSILYVEDNPSNLALIKRILSIYPNIKLFTAPEAKMGIELARGHRPDLILMDINLPGMDGITAMKQLKKYDETKNIPVFALSANAMQSDIRKAMQCGFVEYITKPVDVNLFLKSVCGVLKIEF